MKNVSFAIFLSGAFILGACNDNAKQEDSTNNSMSQDSTTTGLEGTRDQSGTIGGSSVKMDTTAGQGSEKPDSTKANKSGKAAGDTSSK